MGPLAFVRSLFAGRPPAVKAGDLLSEQARPSTTGVNSPHRASVADRLTATNLAILMRNADAGNVEAYLTLAAEMEERESHYRSVLSTRKLGVSGSPALVKASGDSSHEKTLADAVEALITKPEFEPLVLDLMDGVGKGFSCVEIMWDRDARWWEPQSYLFREQRHFVVDSETLSEIRLRTMEDPTNGAALMPYKWLCHRPKLMSGLPMRSGLARTQAFLYSAKRFTMADWLTFLDVFGMPLRVGKYPASMAAQKDELLRAVRRMGSDAAAVIPAEMEIEFVDGANRSGTGAGIFQATAEYFDKQTSKLVLGQTMSSDDGSSLAQSKTHERVRFDIRAADARSVAATINRDLVKPFIDLNFGPQEVYPRVEIQCEEPEDIKARMDATKTFVDMGGQVEEAEVRDMLGWAEPAKGNDRLKPAAVVAAEMAPKPVVDPNAPPAPAPGKDAKPAKGSDKGPAKDDASIESKGPAAKPELNRQRFSRNAGTEDEIDALVDDALEDWRPLLEGNVGRILNELQATTSFDTAIAKLTELKAEAGELLDIKPLVQLLAHETFRVRGVGDASDPAAL